MLCKYQKLDQLDNFSFSKNIGKIIKTGRDKNICTHHVYAINNGSRHKIHTINGGNQTSAGLYNVYLGNFSPCGFILLLFLSFTQKILPLLP